MTSEITMVKEPKQGGHYYSNVCGHRHWWYTGRSRISQGKRVYEFEDICEEIGEYTLEQFGKYFEER